ncbi:hypothetical protein K8I61_11905, partial [bacterium]|nr:hypothetical protein [bacterium]
MTSERMRIQAGAFIALAWLILSLACIGGGDDDDDDDGKSASCPITSDKMVEAPFRESGGRCDDIGLSLVVDKLLLNPDFTIREVRGQYAINNGNTYHLRGAGVSDDTACFATISGAGAFAVRTESLDCEEEAVIDVVATNDPEANAFCDLTVTATIACDDDSDGLPDDDWDDDGDDDWDDDWGDDDDDGYCSDALAALYNDCGMALADDSGQLTEAEAVAACESGDPFANCVAGCVWVSEFCEDVETCVADNCGGVGDDDDDADDDMTGASCQDVAESMFLGCGISFLDDNGDPLDELALEEWCDLSEDFVNGTGAKTDSPTWNCFADCIEVGTCDVNCFNGCLETQTTGGCADTIADMYACGIVFTLGDDYFVFAEDAAQVCDLMDN